MSILSVSKIKEVDQCNIAKQLFRDFDSVAFIAVIYFTKSGFLPELVRNPVDIFFFFFFLEAEHWSLGPSGLNW